MNRLLLDTLAEADRNGTLFFWWFLIGLGIAALAWISTWPIRRSVKDWIARGYKNDH